MKKVDSYPISLRLPLLLRRKLEALAEADRRTLTSMTIVLLERAIEQNEPKQAS